MKYILAIGFACLDLVYWFMKWAPVHHKVTFISRQANEPNIDFKLVAEQLKKDDPGVETVFLCRKLEGGLKSKISYVGHLFVQMHHIATSEAVVLDSYCIVISNLHHRPTLKVIQMWHALGALKKFGYSILDKKEGSSSRIAEAMHMHHGYTKVLASSPACFEAFSEAFNVPMEKMYSNPLPRVDILKSENYQRSVAERIYAVHPQLKEKTNILYVPTFRKQEEQFQQQLDQLVDKIDLNRYNLIVKLHPLSKSQVNNTQVITDRDFNSQEFACVADLVISDYSAIVYEMAIMNKPIYYWTYDQADYVNNRDFYTPYEALPGPKCATVEDLVEAIEARKASVSELKAFCDRYIDPSVDNCTEHLCQLIRSLTAE